MSNVNFIKFKDFLLRTTNEEGVTTYENKPEVQDGAYLVGYYVEDNKNIDTGAGLPEFRINLDDINTKGGDFAYDKLALGFDTENHTLGLYYNEEQLGELIPISGGGVEFTPIELNTSIDNTAIINLPDTEQKLEITANFDDDKDVLNIVLKLSGNEGEPIEKTISVTIPTSGTAGRSIESITGPETSGNKDTYTIHYTDGESTTFDVTNGEPGINGTNGKSIDKTEVEEQDPVDGKSWRIVSVYVEDNTEPVGTFNVYDGKDGVDGKGIDHISAETIGKDGNYYTHVTFYDKDNNVIGEVDIPNGADGLTPHIDEGGLWYIGNKPVLDPDGNTVPATGADGLTPHIDSNTNEWMIGDNSTGVIATGPRGLKGDQGDQGPEGPRGPKGDSVVIPKYVSATVVNPMYLALERKLTSEELNYIRDTGSTDFIDFDQHLIHVSNTDTVYYLNEDGKACYATKQAPYVYTLFVFTIESTTSTETTSVGYCLIDLFDKYEEVQGVDLFRVNVVFNETNYVADKDSYLITNDSFRVYKYNKGSHRYLESSSTELTNCVRQSTGILDIAPDTEDSKNVVTNLKYGLFGLFSDELFFDDPNSNIESNLGFYSVKQLDSTITNLWFTIKVYYL